MANIKRTLDSTDGVQSEKHGFNDFWRFNREEMSKNHKNDKCDFFGHFYVSHDPPRTKLAKLKRAIDSTDGVQFEKHEFSNFWTIMRYGYVPKAPLIGM